ncbi:MAG: hypothetical protein U9N08_04635 [Candidatus Caldatribacteriota bacterium]|nr:hypothetical protein [Candidatus Caldatribacteriota bacterium]
MDSYPVCRLASLPVEENRIRNAGARIKNKEKKKKRKLEVKEYYPFLP